MAGDGEAVRDMGLTYNPPPGVTAEEELRVREYADRVVAAAPPPTPALIARLRPILAATAPGSAGTDDTAPASPRRRKTA